MMRNVLGLLIGLALLLGAAWMALAQEESDGWHPNLGHLDPAEEDDGPGPAAGPHERCDRACQMALEQLGGEVGLANDDHGPFELVSIAPYFDDNDPYHTAVKAMTGRRKDCKLALKLLRKSSKRCGEGCEGQKAIDFLKAGALWCDGERQEAYELVKALDEAGYPGMEREVRERHRTYAKALKQSRPDRLKPSLVVDAERYLNYVMREARQVARDGDVDTAVQMLRAVRHQALGESRLRRLILLEGKLLQKAGRLEEAAAVYYDVWLQDPRSAQAGTVARSMDELEKAGLKENPLGLSERLDRLERIVSRAKPKVRREAREAFEKRFKLSARDAKALLALLDAVRLDKERDREGALAALNRAWRRAKHPVLAARTLFVRGRILRRLDRDEEAIEAYAKLVEQFPKDRMAAEALYEAARLRLYLGHLEEAREAMSLLVMRYPNSPRLPDGLWQAAWADWLAGDAQGALVLLDHLTQNHGKRKEKSGLSYELKATYWKGRCLAKLERNDEAIDTYRFVMERWPMTYYAALAYHQIAALGVDPEKAVPFQPSLTEPVTTDKLRQLGADSTVPAHPRVRRGLELWRTGRREDAKAALWTQLNFRGTPRAVVELLSTFHLLDDDIPKSFWMAKRHGDFSVAPYEGNARLWGLAYPTPERLLPIARKAGKEANMDPALAFAIIRHESGFVSSVKSSVGARGLMQMMPGTAKSIRRQWYGGKGPSDIKDDSDNIHLGMALLRMHQNYFVDNLPLTIGGYNAGSGVAERWFKQFHGLATDEVVELMTYPRTVAYTKKVIGSYYAYRVLIGDGSPPPIPLELPESLGTWGSPKGQELLGQR